MGSVLPGIKGTSWAWSSLSRAMMRRGVAPDRISGIMKLTVLASLGVNLSGDVEEKKYKQIRTDCVTGITVITESPKTRK